MTSDAAKWKSVDHRLVELLLSTTNSAPDFDSILRANASAELPAIDVSPLQGKLLQLLVRISGAKRVLEIGTLGGYSTAWIASGLCADGLVTTIEIEVRHAAMAASNLSQVGLADRVNVRLGDAANILAEMFSDQVEPFDFIFIDADKRSGEAYFKAALKLTRSGGIIICDNVVRGGDILQDDSTDPDVVGTQRLLSAIGTESSIEGTAIQMVGPKGHDGMAILVVN